MGDYDTKYFTLSYAPWESQTERAKRTQTCKGVVNNRAYVAKPRKIKFVNVGNKKKKRK